MKTQTIDGVKVKIQTVDEVYDEVCALGSWCPPLLTVNNSLDATTRKMLATYLVKTRRSFFAKLDGGVITVSFTSESGELQSEILMTTKSNDVNAKPSSSRARMRERQNWHRLKEKVESLVPVQAAPVLPEHVEIDSTAIAVKEWNGERVVTFRDIDEVHQRPIGTASRTFSQNKKRFIEGVDYFHLSPAQMQSTKFVNCSSPKGLVVVTESGYLMLVKSFTDDLSWRVQRELVNTYFKARNPEPPAPAGGTALPFALLRTIMNQLETHRELIARIDSKAEEAMRLHREHGHLPKGRR